MKKALFILLSLAVAAGLFAVITGSAHDFSALGWNTGGEICQPCHTPHNADVSVSLSPLWNHEITTATFTPYARATIDATDLGQPDGDSLLCLSCHDGSVALDSFGGASGSTAIAGSANVGTNLNNDHPVSFTYDATLVTNDGELNAPPAAYLDSASKVQCSSCHDVHNTANIAGLLRISNAGSALCLTCHAK